MRCGGAKGDACFFFFFFKEVGGGEGVLEIFQTVPFCF